MKAVVETSYGSITLMISSGRKGFPHLSYSMHGPVARAFGLDLENANDALARAVALNTIPFGENRQNATFSAPAITSVDGNLIYLLDRSSGQDGLMEPGIYPCCRASLCRGRWPDRD